MVSGKSKGNEFERYVSKKLSMWISGGARDDLFWRTQSSGGRYTQRSKSGKETIHQEGDVASTCSDTEFFSDLFYVECKHYNDINLWSIFTGKGSLYGWCKEYLARSKESGKILFLVVRQNNRPILLFTSEDILSIPILPHISKGAFQVEGTSVIAFVFEEVLDLDPVEFKNLWKSSFHDRKGKVIQLDRCK